MFIKAFNEGLSLKNKHAWAAAIEYNLLLLQNERSSQATLARKYNLSPATVRKYVNIVKKLL